MAKGNPIKAILSIAGNVDPSVEKSINTVQKKFGGLKSVTAAAGVALTAAAGSAVAFGTSAVKAASGFETSMAQVATLLDGTQEEVTARNKQLGDEAIKISSKLGLPYEELTGTIYNVVSAFGDLGDETSAIAELAAKGAKAGGASATESFNLLSAVTKAYGDTSLAAQQKVSDLAFMTVKLGQTSYPELATSIQQVASLSQTMGVSQEELFGVFATLTGVTGNASVVATQYKAALSNLMVPGTAMKEVIEQLGYSSGKAMVEELGLQKTLETLKIAVGDDTLAFGNLFTSVEAKNAVLAMVGAQAENLAMKTGKMSDAAGITEEAYSRATDTLQAKMDIIKQSMNGFKIGVGQSILPVVKDVAGEIASTLPAALDELKPVLESVFAQMQKVIPYIGKAIKGIVPAIQKGISGFVGFAKAIYKFRGVLAPAIGLLVTYKGISKGIAIVSDLRAKKEALVTAGLKLKELWTKKVNIVEQIRYQKTLAMMAGQKLSTAAALKAIAVQKVQVVTTKAVAIATKIAAGAQKVFNLVLSANPIGLIIAGVVALGAGFVLLYKKCEPFRNFINGIGAGIKKGFFAVVGWFKKLPGILGPAFKKAGNGIKTGFSATVNWFKGLPGVFVDIGGKIKNGFVSACSNIGNGIKTGFLATIDWFKNLPATLSNVFAGMGDFFGGVFSSIGEKFPALVGVFDSVKNGIIGYVEGIKGVFNGLIQFVNGVFHANWSMAWESVKNTFGSIFTGLVSLVKMPINAVISLVNSAISGINSINVSVPEWVPGLGGKGIGFNIPQIPMLARGGFTAGPSIAGEAGTEAVISFNQKYHDENVDTWIKAGRMLGASENPGSMLTNNYQYATNNAGDSISNSNKSVSMGGITFSPNITIQGNAQKDDVIKALESVLPDFYDILNKWKRDQEVYAF